MANQPAKRDDELSGKKEIAEKLTKLFDDVKKGFEDQLDRSDTTMDCWELFDCELGRFQNYSSDKSQLFVPLVRNGVIALATRYLNQAFPQSGRHVEAVTGEVDRPYALLALIENYIDNAKIRTQAAPALLIMGQVEGQYNAYVRWSKRTRNTVTREEKPVEIDGVPMPEAGTVETLAEAEVADEMPVLEPLHDSDVLVLPATAASIEEALEMGGSVTVIRRWTKGQIEKMKEDGDFDESEADRLVELMGQGTDNATTQNAAKKLASTAGIHISGKKSFALGYETWTKLKVGDDRRLCRVYFGGEKSVLGCKRNPYWNDRCPVLSASVRKNPGVFKGLSPVAACRDMQVNANDILNEIADQMYYALAPIVTVDPEKTSNWKTLITDVAAVWPVQPEGVKMLEWPNKAREGLEIIAFDKASIFETLGVNPSMLPQQTGKMGGKRNQAEVALEQQVDLLTTADAVTVLEQEILTPYVQMAAEYDAQFRTKEISVRQFGELGMTAQLEQLPPQQMGKRISFRWSGVEVARNAANLQQQIAWLNVVSKIPPQQYAGYRLDVAPLLEHSAGMVFGSRLGRLTFKNARDGLTVSPEIENDLLSQGFEVQTHMADDDAKHIQVHMKAPPSPSRDTHIARHQIAVSMKQQAAMAAQAQQQPGAGRGPQGGAQPAGPRQNKGPPGMIRPESMPAAGGVVPPRRA